MRSLQTLATLFIFVFFFSFSMGFESHEVNSNYSYTETVANADTCNLTSITFPDGTAADLDIEMAKSGFKFSSEILSGNFSQLGDSCWDIICYDSDADPQYVSDTKCLTVTSDGSSEISEGKSNIITVGLGVMVLVSIFFIFLGSRVEGWAWKIVLFGTAGLFLFMCVLYSMVLIDTALGTSVGLIQGYTTFLRVIKVIAGIAILTLLLFAGYKAFMMWQIKRGFRD